MKFEQRYLAVITAFDRGELDESTDIYVDLLKIYKDQILSMLSKSSLARYLHLKIALQYGIQKILIQRIQGSEIINLDLSLFTRSLPLRLKYDAQICDLLHGRKDSSTSFNRHRVNITKQYEKICKRHLKGVKIPEVVNGDVYFLRWVYNDFLKLESFLPEHLSGYVNLGCGCGLFDSLYLHAPRNNVPALLIDNDSTVGPAITHLADLNGLSNMSFSETWPEGTEPPSFVLSIRSCGFLYSARTYDSLFSCLRPGSRREE